MDVYFDNCGQEFQEVVKKVRNDMYVDDLETERKITNNAKKLKSDPLCSFRQGGEGGWGEGVVNT